MEMESNVNLLNNFRFWELGKSIDEKIHDVFVGELSKRLNIEGTGSWEAPSGRRKSWRKKKEAGKGYQYRKNPPGQGGSLKKIEPVSQQKSPPSQSGSEEILKRGDVLSKQYERAIIARDWAAASGARKEYRNNMRGNASLKLSNGRSMKHQLNVSDAKRRRYKKAESKGREQEDSKRSGPTGDKAGVSISPEIAEKKTDRKVDESSGKAEIKGNKTHVFYAGKDGQPVAMDGEFRLVEAESMVPSHDPTSFRKHKDYPKGLQERAYHRDKSEQSKVRTNAQRMHPALIANTNPDALNGPPILNEDGHVLGGNSRAMSLQLVHSQHKEKSKQLREYLEAHSYQFGLKPEDVRGFKNPVLIRVVDTKGKDQNLLVRAMNEGFTQSMDPRTHQVAMSRKLDERALGVLVRDIKPEQTLRGFFNTDKGKNFIHELSRVGIVDDRNRNQYLNKSGKLNEDGKTLVERVLLGKIVDDADVLSNTQPSMVSSLARAVPFLLQAEGYGDSYNVRTQLRDAIQGFNRMNDLGVAPDSSLKGEKLDSAIKFAKNSLDDLFEGVHAVNKDERVGLLFDTLIKNSGVNQLASKFKKYAKIAGANPEGQSNLFGETSADEAFKTALLKAIHRIAEKDLLKKGKGIDLDFLNLPWN